MNDRLIVKVPYESGAVNFDGSELTEEVIESLLPVLYTAMTGKRVTANDSIGQYYYDGFALRSGISLIRVASGGTTDRILVVSFQLNTSVHKLTWKLLVAFDAIGIVEDFPTNYNLEAYEFVCMPDKKIDRRVTSEVLMLSIGWVRLSSHTEKSGTAFLPIAWRKLIVTRGKAIKGADITPCSTYIIRVIS